MDDVFLRTLLLRKAVTTSFTDELLSNRSPDELAQEIKMLNCKSSLVVAISAALMFNPMTAYAGGLFGDGGLIRGSVGKWLDKNVENKITTPIARGAVEAGATAVGCTYGGTVGCALGNSAGQAVNGAFAGGHGGGNQPQPAPAPAPIVATPQYVTPVPMMPAMGNVCVTAFGKFGPGPYPAPIGSPCYWNTPGGTVYGNVGI